jgi:hypothetical protein
VYHTVVHPDEQCNLYVEKYNDARAEWESPTLVAVLSSEDAGDWGGGQLPLSLTLVSSRISPNGRFLAFMSKRPLTGQDNEDATSKEPGEILDQEVYLYDAAHERVICASCNPSGARPHGVLDIQNSGEGLGLLAERPGEWRGQMLAGNIPTWSYVGIHRILYQSRYLTNEGRLFFNSPDQLVTLPAGENYRFKESVYEYEPAGLPSGTCTSAAGCVALLSSGTSDRESAFVDASPDGSNVFFVTYGQLVAADRDPNVDLYDARICTSESPCLKSPAAAPRPCEETKTCRPPATPSPTFETSPPSGSGNVPKTIVIPGEGAHKPPKKHTPLEIALEKCRKLKNHKKRAACERGARLKDALGKCHKLKNHKKRAACERGARRRYKR